MKIAQLTTLALLAAACSGAVLAQPTPAMRGPGEPHRAGHLLHGVELDEAQEDKVFAILHTQEPQRREQAKVLRQSQEGLRKLATSGQYDESKAAALAKAAGAAMAALALQDARTDARILGVMTPEQRQQATSEPARRHPRFDK